MCTKKPVPGSRRRSTRRKGKNRTWLLFAGAPHAHDHRTLRDSSSVSFLHRISTRLLRALDILIPTPVPASRPLGDPPASHLIFQARPPSWLTCLLVEEGDESMSLSARRICLVIARLRLIFQKQGNSIPTRSHTLARSE